MRMKQRIIAAAVAITVLVGTGAAALTSQDAFGAHPSDEPVGIPDSNPVKHPEDGDGVCEKHETVVKVTPSGNHVNVPCHAAKD